MNLFAKQHSRLVNSCKANERAAQEALYKQFYPEMMRLCYRYLKSDDLAKEALNSGFLKVFQHIGEYDEKRGELGAWVRTIIVRSCIDLGRREAKFNQTTPELDEPDEIIISPAVLHKLYAEDILNCIRLLPAATQLVFNLSVIEGYSHKEIGEQLNISESTSRWHLSEGKKQLRTLLISADISIDQPTEKNKKA